MVYVLEGSSSADIERAMEAQPCGASKEAGGGNEKRLHCSSLQLVKPCVIYCRGALQAENKPGLIVNFCTSCMLSHIFEAILASIMELYES